MTTCSGTNSCSVMLIKLTLQELLQNIFRCHVDQTLFCTWCHSSLDNNDSSSNVFLLHSSTICFYCFNANFGIIWKENKHLIGRIIIVSHQHNKITSCWSPFTWFITKLLFKLVQCLIQLILSD